MSAAPQRTAGLDEHRKQAFFRLLLTHALCHSYSRKTPGTSIECRIVVRLGHGIVSGFFHEMIMMAVFPSECHCGLPLRFQA